MEFNPKKRKEDEEKEKYLEQSNQRLKTIVDKKIQTTMIGALSAFEDYILNSDFFASLSKDRKIQLEQLYDQCRSKILDTGNTAKRNLKEEFDQYTIEWNRYTIQLVMKPKQ
jgi:hypothetical protein